MMDSGPAEELRNGLLDNVSDGAREARQEIAQLESRLARARERLGRLESGYDLDATVAGVPSRPSDPLTSPAHFLFLLSDSALPLGSFAFSSGLESYLAHQPSSSASSSFTADFLPASTSSLASTTLPFVLAAYRDPASLLQLDDALDAAIICSVGRRASVAQGRALLALWEKSFAAPLAARGPGGDISAGARALKELSWLLKTGSAACSLDQKVVGGEPPLPPPASGHLAPLFGAVASLVGLTAHQAAYVLVLNHVRAVVSAAVRASVLGPYQAQKILASSEVQGLISAMIEREWDVPVEDAGQSMPLIDLWMGRHELLYSRIFNS